MTVSLVILAAGQGKRMHSNLPKVLHCMAGKPLLEHVLNAIFPIATKRRPIIVYGHQGKVVRERFSHHEIVWVEQEKQLGTGHALLQALPYIEEDDQVLVLYGDIPLISTQTLASLIESTPKDALYLLTANLSDPSGYGRIKRDDAGHIIGIIEEADANDAELAIHEVNSGIYFLPAAYLKKWAPLLQNKNKQQEYYLTDIFALAKQEKIAIHALQPTISEEILGVNDCKQLAELERFYQRRYAEKLMRQGVTLYDPARLDIRGEVTIGRDVTIDVNVIMEGHVTIGQECSIGSNVILRNVILDDRVEVRANSIIDGAEIAADCIIGPFARIRPGTVLSSLVHIGNFVEVKNSEIEMGSKVNHLSYIGDSEIGKRVNVGAGTITCNYDGLNKHKTTIGDDVFIGSGTELIAPITIGEGATIAAGSTVTKDAPSGQLTLTSRIDQRSIQDWKRPQEEKSD